MSTKLYWYFLPLLFTASAVSGQMVTGQDTLIGNEWIRYGTAYYKFNVNADGIYRITGDALQSAGIDLSSSTGATMRVYSLGKQVPLYVSTDGVFSPTDYIEFYGYRNRGEIDRFLYQRPDTDMLNPDHSLYTDKRPYFLTFDGNEPPLRVTQLVNDIANPPAASPEYRHEEIQQFTAAFFDPYFTANDGSSVTYSSYFHGEGFCKGDEDLPSTIITIPASHIALSGPDPTVRLRMTSTNYQPHEISIKWNEQQIAFLEPFEIEIIDTTFTVPLTTLQATNQLRIDKQTATGRLTVVSVTLTYPRQPVADNVTRLAMQAPTSLLDYYYVVEQFAHDNQPPIVYSADGSRRMVAAINGDNKVHFTWPSAAGNARFVLQNTTSSINYISAFTQRIFKDITADDTEYVVISHPDLIAPGNASEYVQYRSSPEGGNFNANAYSILDLYDEFGYGIEKHPQSIRNFTEFMQRHWPSANMIYIIGRGIEYNRSRYENGSWEPFFFVPTFGRPGADNLLAATNWDLVPRYPIGRLAATNQTEISNYLAKVREHDQAIYQDGQTLEDKTWIKNVIHIAGGKVQNEQIQFKSTLNSLAGDLAESDFGAQVFHFQKESSDIISESQSKQIEKLLNEGISILSYLGHSGPSTFEYTINDASEWNNRGRYPVFNAMGCSAGQIHGPVHGLSDRYVLIPNEGAIAFISGSGSQYPGALIAWARPWYDFLGNTNYGGFLGESIRTGLRSVSNFVNVNETGDNIFRFLLEQQTFQGDPALRIHPLPGPDYVVGRKSVSFSPELISTDTDSFELDFSIFNIGRNLRQDVEYRVRLRFPEGTELLLAQDTFHAGRFENRVSMTLALPADMKPGSYRLLIDVDPANVLAELPAPAAEANNSLEDQLGVEGIPIVLVSNVVTAIYPPDFAIVNKTPVLIAAASNPFSEGLDMQIEIDTTALFNSPLHIRESFTDHAALLKWSPLMTWVEDQVYYWRVSYDSLSPEQPFYWSNHSFIYKPGSAPGWNQSHFYQFTQDDLQYIEADSTALNFDFGKTVYNFRILNRYQDPQAGLNPFGYLDNVFYTEFFTKFTNSNVNIFFCAVNPETGEFLLNPPGGLYGSFNNLTYTIHCFPFSTATAAERKVAMDFYTDIVPDGYIVFFYTYQRPVNPSYFPEQWAGDEALYGQSLFSLVEASYPNSQIRTLETTGSVPYIVQFYKNGGPIEEVIAKDTAEAIALSYDIARPLSAGTFTSTLVGPASKWYSILQDISFPDIDTIGQSILSAYALSADLQDTLWISHNLRSTDTIISDIDATVYPFIRLRLHTQDSVSRDPAIISYWRVLYEGYPEFIFTKEPGFEYVADTLFQGQDMKLNTYVENLSDYAANDVPVSLRVLGGEHTTVELYDTISQLEPLAYAPVSFVHNTKELEGDYQVVAEINADRNLQEVTYTNNIGILPLHIISDKVNPLLDVTFDGHHIQDGDLVAAKPLISIQLHDENEFIRITDTASFSIYLKFPSDPEPRYVAFNNNWVTFIPAGVAGRNQAVVELRPDLHEEGVYELQVQARDASGNEAGDNEYYVSFRVTHEKSISHIYNFPNPFRTSTRFVYTLTGEGAPAFYQIQIMSVTGIMVREISSEEIGPLDVGTHMTDYEWDGTDNHGNVLPGGMYIYRMVARDADGNDYPLYEQFGDAQFFRKGWGKLVILH